MSKPVTTQEWEQFKKRELTPQEMADVSERMKDFGMESIPSTSTTDRLLLRLTPNERGDETDDDTLSALVEGKLDHDARQRLEAMRETDPIFDARLSAVEAADRQVKASLSVVPNAQRKEAKRPFLTLVAGGGWLAAAACLALFFVVVPGMNARLTAVDKELGDLKRLQVVTPGDIFGSGTGSFDPDTYLVPKGSKYVGEGSGATFQFEPDSIGVSVLKGQPLRYLDSATQIVAEMRSSHGAGIVGMSPELTLVSPGRVDALRWTVAASGATFDVQLKGPDGTIVFDTKGVAAQELTVPDTVKAPGGYTWTLTSHWQDGTTSVSTTQFGMADESYASRTMKSVGAVPDPLSKAVRLAEAGYRLDALRILNALVREDPANSELPKLVKTVETGPSRK